MQPARGVLHRVRDQLGHDQGRRLDALVRLSPAPHGFLHAVPCDGDAPGEAGNPPALCATPARTRRGRTCARNYFRHVRTLRAKCILCKRQSVRMVRNRSSRLRNPHLSVRTRKGQVDEAPVRPHRRAPRPRGAHADTAGARGRQPPGGRRGTGCPSRDRPAHRARRDRPRRPSGPRSAGVLRGARRGGRADHDGSRGREPARLVAPVAGRDGAVAAGGHRHRVLRRTRADLASRTRPRTAAHPGLRGGSAQSPDSGSRARTRPAHRTAGRAAAAGWRSAAPPSGPCSRRPLSTRRSEAPW